MKKMFLLGALFAAGLGFTACSSEKDVAENPSPFVESGESYMSLAIQLPTAPLTRAANDNFKDGLATEYAVKDATLLLFRGTSESTATFINSYELKLGSWNIEGNSTDQITTTAEIVQAISNSDKPSGSNNLYAFVVLNKTQSNLVTTLTGATGKTFKNLFGSTNRINNNIDITKGFVMTNAPLATNAGTSVAPSSTAYTVLAAVDAAKIFSTEVAAKGNPATTVYVERNVAKVTVADANGNVKATTGTDDFKDQDNNNVAWKINKWSLDNTAPSSYFQRQIESSDFTLAMPEWYNYTSTEVSSNGYRFVGNNTVGSKYRIYWGDSPLYSSDASSFTKVSEATEGTGDSKPQYCYENTFEVSKQKESHTTRALIQLELNSGKNFYTIDGAYCGKSDGSTTNLKKKIIALLASNTTVQSKMGTVFSPTEANSTVEFSTSGTSTTVTKTTVVLGDGSHTLNFTSDTDLQSVVDEYFNNTDALYPIVFYKDGLSYYRILIKHFGDDLTPWNAADHLSDGPYEVSSTISPQNYLGRYGVLRNNWYNITINNVKGFGLPTIPSVPNPGTDDPWDDEVKSYIAAKINILSWAYRNQNAEL